ncbi:MAG: zinc ribbon domain-containing protein [Desulfobacterales bacterium]|nr:zinc ribbon domain-containing protein [Desulfobacterales bacterium]MCP4158974.1 zinc ribbon domain-containing protein [Deltaproteobacteria bacterium]
MPIYEYECSDCGVVIEAVQKISDKPLTDCEKCDGKLKKIMSQSTFHLKGGGWYADTYGKSSDSSGKSKTSDTKNVAKTDKKPAKTASKKESVSA